MLLTGLSFQFPPKVIRLYHVSVLQKVSDVCHGKLLVIDYAIGTTPLKSCFTYWDDGPLAPLLISTTYYLSFMFCSAYLIF